MDELRPERESAADETLERLLERARKDLVETNTRNRLIHVNRENQRANALNIINERSDDIYEILKLRGRRMRFLATARDTVEDIDRGVPLLESISDGDLAFDQARYTDNQLETPLGPDALQKRLLRLARDARTAEEEQGINILFLAVGFLTWFEDKNSDVRREAPLILLPVELVRNVRTSTYDLKCREDDIAANLPLQERLKRDFGIDIPEIDTDEDGFSPAAYFDRIEAVTKNRERWSVDRDGMQLGFFSFAKLLMLKDLNPDAWGEDGLIASTLIDGLLRRGFKEEPPLFSDKDRLDDLLDPNDIIQVVDADASQTKVIEEVRAGRNLVVQGPPGTGKSQTITNIIASAAHDGKSVLFVAEKMAALSVVHGKLEDTGLDSLCLELHSRAANKRKVIGELARTLAAGTNVPAQPTPPDRLKELRDKLNGIEKTLHGKIPGTDGTPFDAIAIMCRLAGLGAPPPKLQLESLANMSREELAIAMKGTDDYGSHVAQYGSRDRHPFFGVGNLAIQPTDIRRLGDRIRDSTAMLQRIANATETLGRSLDVDSRSLRDCEAILKTIDLIKSAPPSTKLYLRIVADTSERPRLILSVEVCRDWQTSKQAAADYVDAAWQAPADRLRSSVARGVGSFFVRLGSNYRSASRELATLLNNSLPRQANDRLHLVDRLITLQQKRQKYQDQSEFLRPLLGGAWQGEDTPFSEFLEVASWYEQLTTHAGRMNLQGVETILNSADSRFSETLRTLLSKARHEMMEIANELQISVQDAYGTDSFLDADMASVILRLETIEANLSRYDEWCLLQRSADNMASLGLGPLADRIDAEELDTEAAKLEVQYAYSEALWTLARSKFQELDTISEYDRHEFVEAFCERERERVADVRKLIKSKHLDQLPTGAVGEMAIIRGEIARKNKHKSIRKLFGLAGSMVQRIKPVLLMSPISVAQFLAPGSIRFDLLVIDEASQVRPEEALGAIARSKQIVVVGDQKQLPPTSFFDRLTGNSDEDDDDELTGGAARATDMESILSLCEARSIPSRMLEWHYRSRDPSLIAVSNDEFYKTLILPPSPLQHDGKYGFRLVPVQGAYSSKSKGSGRPGTNQIEAQEIVDTIAHHARNQVELSIGVVTFSATQRNMVTELLELSRRKDPILDDFLKEGKKEDFFVKNIENVQGDERDVILISVGYGPVEPGGRLQSMSFGPINSDGGERRLNVLFSRARVRCDVYASFDPNDIDVSRTQKDGPRILKRYLQYAKTGVLEEARPIGGAADSPFEEDVAKVIRQLGYDVDHQVGSSGFKIDLGVKQPENRDQYMIAVECDGASYHSALWARERDRLRQEILEHLGWRFHRIWSTDWFYRREKEIDRLRNALDDAAQSSSHGISVSGANQGCLSQTAQDGGDNAENDTAVVEIPAARFDADPYEIVQIDLQTTVEPHEASLKSLCEVVRTIVCGEGPIHQEEVARRLASAFGKDRAGRRILERTIQALRKAEAPGDHSDPSVIIRSDGPFWFTNFQESNPRIRNRSTQTHSLQKAEMIPPLEIAAAIRSVVAESGNSTPDEIVKAVAKTFGFERVGSSLRETITKTLNQTMN